LVFNLMGLLDPRGDFLRIGLFLTSCANSHFGLRTTMCLHSRDGFAVFVRKIKIAQVVSFYMYSSYKEIKFFIFFTNSKIVLA